MLAQIKGLVKRFSFLWQIYFLLIADEKRESVALSRPVELFQYSAIR